MKQYRVTKYDPAYRDADGVYQKDEWTDFSDIGKSFSGRVLTKEEYDRTENDYIQVCLEVWEKQGRPALFVKDLEKKRFSFGIPKVVRDKKRLSAVIRKILENKIWAKLSGDGFFIHFGYDYIMYIGTESEAAEMTASASAHRLFCEETDSPYSEE